MNSSVRIQRVPSGKGKIPLVILMIRGDTFYSPRSEQGYSD